MLGRGALLEDVGERRGLRRLRQGADDDRRHGEHQLRRPDRLGRFVGPVAVLVEVAARVLLVVAVAAAGGQRPQDPTMSRMLPRTAMMLQISSAM